jgi:hypothetical protein
MTKTAIETPIHTIGLDIAKHSFSVHGFDAEGKTVVARELKRGQNYGDSSLRITVTAQLTLPQTVATNHDLLLV